MKDKKKKITLGLLISCLVLTSVSISLTGAWYYNASILRVDNLVISTSDDYEIKIADSIDGEYKSTYQDNSFDDLFVPVTSMYHDEWLNNESKTNDYPLFYGGYQRYSTSDDTVRPSIVELNEGYFSKEFYLLVNADCYISISKDDTYFIANDEKNENYINLYHPGGGITLDTLSTLKNAMRYSIYVPEDNHYYILDMNKDSEPTYYGGILDTSYGSGYYDYYSKDSEYYECLYGDVKNRDKILYSKDPLSEDSAIDKDAYFKAKHKKGVHTILLNESIENGVKIEEEDSVDLSLLGTATDVKANNVMIECKANTPKKIVLSIYMEGWDKACINTTMGASFKANISFNVAREK